MAEGTGLPPQLLRSYLSGKMAAKIQWGEPGDFMRCVRVTQEETGEDGDPLPDHIVKGLCATLHKIATGATPGHAAGEGG